MTAVRLPPEVSDAVDRWAAEQRKDLNRSEAGPAVRDRAEGEEMKVPRVSWAAVGHVQTPGRYMFKFGWVTISEDDLAVWRDYRDATFALYECPAQGGEYRLGSFDPEPGQDRELRGLRATSSAEPKLSCAPPDIQAADEPASSSSEEMVPKLVADAEGTEAPPTPFQD